MTERSTTGPCPNGHPNQGGKFCTECGTTLTSTPARPRWRRWWPATVAVVVVGLIGAGAVLTLVADGGADEVTARCVDESNDLITPEIAPSMDEGMIDIAEATLRHGGETITATITLADEPDPDTGDGQGRSHEITFLDPEGQTLYQARLAVNHSRLNDHDLEASLVAFDDRATELVPGSGIDEGATITDAVTGGIHDRSITLQIDADELPDLPQDFYWTASASQGEEPTAGPAPASYDVCPYRDDSADHGLPVSDYAAASEGTTDAAMFLDRNEDDTAALLEDAGLSPADAECVAAELRPLSATAIDNLLNLDSADPDAYADEKAELLFATVACDTEPPDALSAPAAVEGPFVLTGTGIGEFDFGFVGDELFGVLEQAWAGYQVNFIDNDCTSTDGQPLRELTFSGSQVQLSTYSDDNGFSGFRLYARMGSDSAFEAFRTAQGVGIGDDVADLRDAYGDDLNQIDDITYTTSDGLTIQGDPTIGTGDDMFLRSFEAGAACPIG